jgi:hypothetical protein
MAEQSTEFTLTGLVGLIFGLIVVLVFFALVFAQNVMSTVADSKQAEQFEALMSGIEKVCGSQYHSSVYGLSITVFEEYQIKYAPNSAGFTDSAKVEELGCNTKCICALHDDKAIRCKSMIALKEAGCKNAEVKENTGLLGGYQPLSLPYISFLGDQASSTCKYRLSLWWDNGNVVAGGEAQEVTRATGQGEWTDIGTTISVGTSC